MSFKSRRAKLKDVSLNTSVGALPPDKSIGQPEKCIRKNVIEDNIYSIQSCSSDFLKMIFNFTLKVS